MKLSIVVPCYNEQEAVPIFYTEVKKVLVQIQKTIASGLTYELVFVDDGSKDGTLTELKQLSVHDESVRYVSFSRNFGKEAAMYAGLRKAQGDYVALMDADLQDPPGLLPQMLESLMGTEDYDCAACRRTTRKGEPVIRSVCSKLFYKFMAKLTDIQVVDGARDFRVMKRPMVDAILSLTEVNRFSKGIFQWVGFRTKWFEYKNIERCAGRTKWSFWQLFMYSLDGITTFSTKPLAMASFLGILSILVSFLLIIFIIVRTNVWGDPTRGWPSMICIIFFIGGVQLFSIGILGQYLAKIFTEVKHRPVYIVREEK